MLSIQAVTYRHYVLLFRDSPTPFFTCYCYSHWSSILTIIFRNDILVSSYVPLLTLSAFRFRSHRFCHLTVAWSFSTYWFDCLASFSFLTWWLLSISFFALLLLFLALVDILVLYAFLALSHLLYSVPLSMLSSSDPYWPLVFNFLCYPHQFSIKYSFFAPFSWFLCYPVSLWY
jgi:hypothetical protein